MSTKAARQPRQMLRIYSINSQGNESAILHPVSSFRGSKTMRGTILTEDARARSLGHTGFGWEVVTR